MTSRDDPIRFDRAARERILARATQVSGVSPQEGLTDRQIVEAAAEAGIPGWAVAAAIRDERLGLLRPDSDDPVLIRRTTTSRDPDLIVAELGYELGRRECVRIVNGPNEQVWRPHGWWPDDRTVMAGTEVTVRTSTGLDGTVLTLMTDLSAVRRRHLTGWALAGAFATGALVASLPVFLLPLAAVLLLGGALTGGAASYRLRVAGIARRIDELIRLVAPAERDETLARLEPGGGRWN